MKRWLPILLLAACGDNTVPPCDPDAPNTICTIAGDGHKGNIGDGGPAIAAEFGWDTSNTPPVSGAVALDPKRPGLLYIADSANNRIRRLHLDTGLIDCIAGNSSAAGYSGDGGDAINATMSWPLGDRKSVV